MNNLQKKVIEQLGYSELCADCIGELENVLNCGAAGGFGGFIYYYETTAFYVANRESISALVSEMASDMGISAIELIQGFNCLNGEYSLDEIAEAFYTTNESESAQYIQNSLAWFALEETARALADD